MKLHKNSNIFYKKINTHCSESENPLWKILFPVVLSIDKTLTVFLKTKRRHSFCQTSTLTANNRIELIIEQKNQVGSFLYVVKNMISFTYVSKPLFFLSYYHDPRSCNVFFFCVCVLYSIC